MDNQNNETPQEAREKLLAMSGNLSLEQLDEVARLMIIAKEGSSHGR